MNTKWFVPGRIVHHITRWNFISVRYSSVSFTLSRLFPIYRRDQSGDCKFQKFFSSRVAHRWLLFPVVCVGRRRERGATCENWIPVRYEILAQLRILMRVLIEFVDLGCRVSFRPARPHVASPNNSRRCIALVSSRRGWWPVFIYHRVILPLDRLRQRDFCSYNYPVKFIDCKLRLQNDSWKLS